MGGLLRAGGILLTLGSLIYVVGAYARIRYVQIANVRSLFPSLGEISQDSGGWASFAPWIGLALMALGLLAALAVVFLVIRNALASREQTRRRTGDFVTILNRILQLEHDSAVTYSHWVSLVVSNQSIAEKVKHLAQDSVEHFDRTATMVRQLDGTTYHSFESSKDGADLKQAF